MNSSSHKFGEPGTVSMSLAAVATAREDLDTLTKLRRNPGDRFPPTVQVNFLKSQDEHTLVALLAVSSCIRDNQLAETDFSEWGIVAASRFIGRRAMLKSLERFEQDGPWGASLHVVPMHSPHSVAGALSLTLSARGPNVGVGCGPDCEAEAFVVAASLMAHENLPGLWMIVSGWDDDCDCDHANPESARFCQATALLFRPVADSTHSLGTFTIQPSLPQGPFGKRSVLRRETTVASLITTLARPNSTSFETEVNLGGGLVLKHHPVESIQGQFHRRAA